MTLQAPSNLIPYKNLYAVGFASGIPTKSLCAMVFVQMVYSTVFWGNSWISLWQRSELDKYRMSVM